ncbi:MAG TPA: PKD domain-containing protein, partial [Myxococcaceae bacterium]|nr:PKD domain-containing protein [Myxococcaceae bacterium]
HGSQLLMRREFAPLFERYGVDMVLTGHDHNYERTRLMKGNGEASDGIPYLVVGSGGRSLRTFKGSQPAWSVVRNDKDFGYLDVKVEEGTLDARMVTAAGKVLDSFTLTKQLPAAPRPATLALTVEGERGVAPHQVLFRATPSLPGASVLWDFGDGQAAEGLEVPHLYTQPGTYSVTATATAGDQTVTSTTTVVVGQGEQTPTSPTPSEPSTGAPTPEPSTGTPTAPVTEEPGLPQTLPEPPPGMDGLGPNEMGCSAGAAATLFPVGVLLLAGALRRRRR